MTDRNNDTLMEALNDCIDRMAAGASLDACLRIYPRYARELRPMLEAGLLVARAQADAMEVAAAQGRVRSAVIQTLDMPSRSRTGLLRYGNLAAAVALVALIALIGAGVVEVARRIRDVVPTPAITTEPLATPSDVPSATPTPSITPSVTATLSPTPSATPTMSATPSPTATRTASSTSTSSAVPTSTATRVPPSAAPTVFVPTTAPAVEPTDDSDDGDNSGSSGNSGSGGSDDDGGDDNSGRGGDDSDD